MICPSCAHENRQGAKFCEECAAPSLKGRTEAVAAYRVDSIERPEGAATAVFVGRDEELGRLGAVYEQAVEKPATCLAVLLGSPGLGKSRLIAEFAQRRSDRALRRRRRCHPRSTRYSPRVAAAA